MFLLLLKLLLAEYYTIQISKFMQSPIEDTIKDQIMKYGTIAVDTLIELIVPFLPPFLSREDVRSIAVLLLSVVTPAAFIGGSLVTVSALSDVAIFGFKTAKEVTSFGAKAVYYTGKTTLKAVTTTASVATDLLICKPFYLITYPFRKLNNQQYNGLLNAISRKETESNKAELQKFQEMSKGSDKVFLVIRKIEESSQKISVKMMGTLAPSESLGTILNYLRQRDPTIEGQSIQFICNRNLININVKVGDLAKNSYGFVDLYFAKMETFG